MRRFLPGAISCSSCSGDKAAMNLSIRSELDFQARIAESTIRVSKDSLACMAQSFLSRRLSTISAARSPAVCDGQKNGRWYMCPVAEFLLDSQSKKPLAMLDVAEHLNDAGKFG